MKDIYEIKDRYNNEEIFMTNGRKRKKKTIKVVKIKLKVTPRKTSRTTKRRKRK